MMRASPWSSKPNARADLRVRHRPVQRGRARSRLRVPKRRIARGLALSRCRSHTGPDGHCRDEWADAPAVGETRVHRVRNGRSPKRPSRPLRGRVRAAEKGGSVYGESLRSFRSQSDTLGPSLSIHGWGRAPKVWSDQELGAPTRPDSLIPMDREQVSLSARTHRCLATGHDGIGSRRRRLPRPLWSAPLRQ